MKREKFFRSFLEEFLRKRGESLGKDGFDFVLRELLRLAYFPQEEGYEVLKTADGSLTLLSLRYGEPFHSQSAGAVRESYFKFLKPSRLLRKARTAQTVRILDIGFGLGYNLAVALKHIWEENPRVRVEVYSLEKELLESIPLLPSPYRDIHKWLLDRTPEYEDERLKLKVLVGDAREKIREIEGFVADAVFHDPFSPYKNPELWTLDFLKLVSERLSPEGYWVSYTSSLAVRKALVLLGFRVGSSVQLGRKRSGTVASKRGTVPPMDEDEMRKLTFSPYAIALRDEGLNAEPLEILTDYLIGVYKRIPKT
ncbi:MAG: hypothetical protein GXO04_03395 [Aquificae bacterium]|nr:hypothetical protein [Aquificota bacterium]